MRKNLILPIVATAALVFTSAGTINADAATPTVEKKVYVSQYGNVNSDQLNHYLQKYLNNFQIIWNPVNKQAEGQKTPEKTTQQTTVQQPTNPSTNSVPSQKQPEQTAPTATENSQVSAFEQKVVELTNQERAKQGLPALKLDTELSKVARTKSLDMQNKGYFSHTSPTYGSPFDMMKQFGISYRSAGENIAMGQQSPEAVVNAWMNSEGHRANILNSSYTHIGVGHVSNGNYWTQMFIGK